MTDSNGNQPEGVMPDWEVNSDTGIVLPNAMKSDAAAMFGDVQAPVEAGALPQEDMPVSWSPIVEGEHRFSEAENSGLADPSVFSDLGGSGGAAGPTVSTVPAAGAATAATAAGSTHIAAPERTSLADRLAQASAEKNATVTAGDANIAARTEGTPNTGAQVAATAPAESSVMPGLGGYGSAVPSSRGTIPEAIPEAPPGSFAEGFSQVDKHNGATVNAEAAPAAGFACAPTSATDAGVESTQVRRRHLLDSETPGDEVPATPELDPNWEPRVEEPASSKDDLEEAIFAGATLVPTVPSRKGAHAWSLLIYLLAVPLGWYLAVDGAARLTLAQGAPWHSGRMNLAALAEVIAAGIIVLLVALSTRWSCLGAFFMGTVVTILGVPFIFAPAWTKEVLSSALAALDNFNAFGQNLANYLQIQGPGGSIFLFGLLLLGLGFGAHGARRKGRKETQTREAVAGHEAKKSGTKKK